MVWNKLHMHLDPGPGALVHSIEQGLDPMKINALLVSHAHPDHYTDAEVLIEAMTRGTTKKRGFLVGSHSVLFGNEACEAAVSKYHQTMPETVVEAKVDQRFSLEEVKITATKSIHSDPDTVGFKIEFPSIGGVGYTSDTQLFEGISKYYEGVRLLILCTMRPRNAPWKYHMSTEDAVKITQEVKPEMAVITHFGVKMIFSNPSREAEFIEQQTGIRTLAAVDGMRVKVGKEIQVSVGGKLQKGLYEFFSKA